MPIFEYWVKSDRVVFKTVFLEIRDTGSLSSDYRKDITIVMYLVPCLEQ